MAIKRAQQGSMQGGLEFKTEIELLSRVHHKNLVGLVGFCFEQGEQMLVYEFMVHGTLRDNLLGNFSCNSANQVPGVTSVEFRTTVSMCYREI